MAHGTLIVLDGIDGSGKATQARRLVERLRRERIYTVTLDFPRYQHNFFGALIGECLRGEHGDFVGVDPHIASVLYAADRLETRPLLREWLDEGAVVVLDRYVSANQIHQGGKIQNEQERVRFLEWLDRLEHGVFCLPRPDLTLFLDMPTDLALTLLSSKRLSEKKQYLKGGRDVAESNRTYLQQSRESAHWIGAQQPAWKVVSCASGKEVRSVDDIHQEVYTHVLQTLGRERTMYEAYERAPVSPLSVVV